MPSNSSALAVRRCRADDLAALVGLLAVFEGEMMTGEMPEHLADRIGHRLEREGLLATDADERERRQAINDLNHRLRYALGEYDEPPQSQPVPDLG